MNDRDVIAIKAMEAELSSANYDDDPMTAKNLAEFCYQMADAMIEAGKKGMH